MSCRSREGAWIEIGIISSQPKRNRSRSREGAWIEIAAADLCCCRACVAPARERGLKPQVEEKVKEPSKSLPQGSVD